MEETLKCLRCGTPMSHIMTENLQLGKTSWLFGDWPNLLAGALYMDIYCCPNCGKMEFFRAGTELEAEDEVPQKKCPQCGRMHDFDWPKCPYCKYDYNK